MAGKRNGASFVDRVHCNQEPFLVKFFANILYFFHLLSFHFNHTCQDKYTIDSIKRQDVNFSTETNKPSTFRDRNAIENTFNCVVPGLFGVVAKTKQAHPVMNLSNNILVMPETCLSLSKLVWILEAGSWILDTFGPRRFASQSEAARTLSINTEYTPLCREYKKYRKSRPIVVTIRVY